ncbi:hypothetical protein QTO34_005543 [Cnephaeus nilssonii]|uniref:Uncharacterized protein n=1 Tax=Cnephaeus nilssonii TaxID=3371016 RepID=A0AA40HNM8_CNENI|nr:hypothetical protein QTO34_005543 [Eptesicus nilssonii]
MDMQVPAPAQEAEAASPDAELEASPPPELSPPPAASPAAAVEPGRPQRKLRPQHRWMKNPPWSPWWLLPQRRSCLWRAQLKGPLLNVLKLSEGKNLNLKAVNTRKALTVLQQGTEAWTAANSAWRYRNAPLCLLLPPLSSSTAEVEELTLPQLCSQP